MKMSHVKNAASKIAFPVMVCGMLLTGVSARAQAGVGDICSVHPNNTYSVPLRTSGETVSFSIRLFSLYGNFTREYLGGLNPIVADVISPFEIRVVTGSGLSYARLVGINNTTAQRTDLRFEYTVKSGDLAFPMRIHGSAGTGVLSGEGYQFNDGQWRIYNPTTTSNAVWRYTAEAYWNSGLGDVFDPTMQNANIRLQTLKFDTDVWTVPQTRTIVGTVSTDEAVSNNVPFYVWSADTNIAQIVEQQPGEVSTPLVISKGTSQITFRIKGVAMGATEIYLSPAAGLTPGLTNYIKKAVTVSEPPPPTASVVLSSGLDVNGLMQVSLDETDTNVNTLKVVLSEPYTTNVVVSLVTDPAVQQKLEFLSDPSAITIAQGATESAWISYRVRDGLSSIRILPTFANGAANAFYTIKESATVNIRNVKPALVRPSASDVIEVYRLTPYTFDWEISDVSADMTNGMKVAWHFGETGLTNKWGNGGVGSISHTFTTAGTKTVKVWAVDKDGGNSDPVYFTVEVREPAAIPKVRVVTNARVFSETDVKNSGEYFFTLSEPFPYDVTVGLVTDALATQSLVFAHSNPITIPAGQTNSSAVAVKFSMPDGTLATEAGMVLQPVVLSGPEAVSYFSTDVLWLYVTNAPPVVDRLMGYKVVNNTISNAVTFPANVNKEFECYVKDVAADLSSVVTYWDFGDGTGTFTASPAAGATNSVRVALTHTYTVPGTYTAWVWAADKDGSFSQEVQFTVVVQQTPTVRVLTPSGALSEKAGSGALDYITVQLTSAFTSPVTVNLTVTPPNSSLNGAMTLAQYAVTFPAGTIGQTMEQQVSILDIKDGTAISQSSGFQITPSVAGLPAQAFYGGNMVSGTVRIFNEAPELTTDPLESPITGTDVAAIVTQDAEALFYWNVADVNGDLSTMQVTWYFGNATVTRTGPSGVVTNIFDSSGDKIIRAVAVDKDGASDTVYFKIRVQLAKTVDVTPVGPVRGGPYASAAGLGNGLVFSDTAEKRIIEQNVFTFKYHPEITSARLTAVPYKTGPGGAYMLTNYISRVLGVPGVTAFGTPATLRYYDSFFYVWVGADQGLTPPESLVAVATPVTTVTLPAAQQGGTGSVDTRSIQAIFSREYRPQDNVGDINDDGIPDLIAIRYGFPTLLGSDLASARGYNDDLDFLPGSASDGTGIIAGLTNVWSAVGTPFTAFLEVRGYHEGLNSSDFGSDPDFGPGEQEVLVDYGVSAERPTDPTKLDTDGDGYPDGWEYYFWYNTLVRKMSGERYNPLDVAQGIEIPWYDIYERFDPLIPSADLYGERDLDGDGLTDFEELATGTNPIHWDTDGDGMCDGWEMLRGLNPSDPRDGLDPTRNNPDGDYMAISVVPRDFVTDDNGTTYLRASDGTLTTFYRYGNTNAPIAVGRPATLPAGINIDEAQTVTTNAVILHFQVFHEFGFDPRTAWVGSVGRVPTWVRNHPVPAGWGDLVGRTASFVRFPVWAGSDAANTRPFTSLDEYLLMKFMSENRVGGAGASIGAGDAANKTAEWSRWSTHPRTPDTDASAALADGVPDGWELYVSCAPGTRAMTITPWAPQDFDDDVETPAPPLGDGLTVQREYAGVDSCAAYANPALYGAGLATVTITRPAIDALWLNKFWPTNPWSKDTDGDGLNDAAERAFMYGTPTDDGSTCIVGGGLNPNSVDTDLDGLPDAWENQFGESVSLASGGVTNVVAGMDGTVQDDRNDNDQDGLLNYQEYWVQAMRHFRYDIPDVGITGPLSGNTGLPIDASFLPEMLFTPVTNPWDVAQYPWGDTRPQLWYMLPVGPARLYVSTDPRDHDTDLDGMDDYYEIFHGLNPILGNGILASGLDDRVGRAYIDRGVWTLDWGSTLVGNDWWSNPFFPIPRDFVTYPWLAGMPDSDPDADGLLNVEEALLANTAAPAHSNTDPTPLWMTDSGFFPSAPPLSYSPASYTVRFYGPGVFGTPMFFWPGSAPIPLHYQMYTFEMNEGYDTDNDGVSDKAELVSGPSGNTDPQDHDSPARRQALWFDGTQSAAQNLMGYSYGEWGLLSFTVELWAKPEAITATEQVLLERSIPYSQSDLGSPAARVRRNFRIGIDANTGRIFAMFQNAGEHDDHTGVVYAYGRVIVPGEWVHIAARMDGNGGVFTLLINGETAATVNTTLLPANGVVSMTMDPANPGFVSYLVVNPGVIVTGAANDDPGTLPPSWGTFHSFYQGWIDEVRIWDGARTTADIQSDVKKRYQRGDLLANRAAVIADRGAGASRVIGNARQLIPELLYHYTFDNLFSSHDDTQVATSPRGFNDATVDINRPFSFIFWWGAMMGGVNSQVYNDYGYVPWIENGVEHLPRVDGTVPNSVFWSVNGAGPYTGQNNLFPNSNDPYGMIYRTSPTPPLASLEIKSDLLPFGMAWAKQTDDMWDEQGPSGNWADAALDTDSDGLADWWEILHGLDPTIGGITADGWNGLYPDGSGMTNGERYLRDLAAGWRAGDTVAPSGPVQTADSDGDEMPDWWEALYNLNPFSAEGDDGAGGDLDRDGLSNYAEYLVSEKYGALFNNTFLRPNQIRTAPAQTVSDYFLKPGGSQLYLGQMFSDHDFMEDAWEDQFAMTYISRYVYDPHLDNDGDGWSNWAECRYSAAGASVRPDRVMSTGVGGTMYYEFPIPLIETTLRYNGVRGDGALVVHAFSASATNGQPDAVFRLPTGVAGTVKTYMVGDWKPKTVNGVLSPGGVQPGTISYTFTDSWTGLSMPTGFDRDGKLYSGSVGGTYEEIGTIDYVTGEFSLDLDSYAGSWIVPAGNTGPLARNQYIDVEISSIVVNYTTRPITGWPKQAYLGRADIGYILEGTNTFFVFMDLDNNGIWSAGEPCGVSAPAATEIGWHRNQISVELTDYTVGQLRMDVVNNLRTEDVFFGTGDTTGGDTGGTTGTGGGIFTRVRVQRRLVDGLSSWRKVVVDKVLDSSFAYLHEGVVFQQGQFALDWGMVDVTAGQAKNTVVYEVYVNDDRTDANLTGGATYIFTNTFDSVRAKAAELSPAGAYVYAARPTFKWKMPNGYNAFALEIRQAGSTAAPLVYSSGTQQAPARDEQGHYVWQAPISANDLLPSGVRFDSNKVYYWRVIAMNAKFSTAAVADAQWSDFKSFRLNVNTPNQAGYGSINTRIKYYGPAANLTDRVKVQVFGNAGFAGVPLATYTLKSDLLNNQVATVKTMASPVVNAVLSGLPVNSARRPYYVRAYIDQNQNGRRDVWESWGYANYYGITESMFDPRPVIVEDSTNPQTVDIVIEDADTDQDWFPDSWEYEQNPGTANFLELIGPATGTAGDNGVNPGLSTAGRNAAAFVLALSLGTTDLDGDGLDDLSELLLGSDVSVSSTAGDGFSDGDKVALGLAPADVVSLSLTGFAVDAEAQPVIQWVLGVQKAGDVNRSLIGALSTSSSAGTATYQILYSPTLSNPDWRCVRTGMVPLSGVQTLVSAVEDSVAVEPGKGFFRVRLVTP